MRAYWQQCEHQYESTHGKPRKSKLMHTHFLYDTMSCMQEMYTAAIGFIPSENQYIQALGIVAFSAFVALVVIPLIDGVISFFTRKTQTDLDDRLRAAIRWPFVYIVVLLGAVYATTTLALGDTTMQLIHAWLYSMIVLVVAHGVVKTTRALLGYAIGSSRVSAVNEQTAPLFGNATFALVLVAALYALFLVWGIDVTAWLASAGILGIAIGFAAKDTLSNLISGVFILADKPYAIGDYIVLSSGTTGIVENIGLRSTRIRTFNDEEVTIPNGAIANEELVNKTAGPHTGRVKVSVGVAYGTDPRTVEALLLDIARVHEKILADPEPAVHFIAFGDSSLDFQLSCRVRDPLDVFGVQSELRYAIINRFVENSIEIPFPQRDVHLHQ